MDWSSEHELSAKKSLGQNFLTSPTVPNWLVEAGEVVKGDMVVEIGPGTGMLTAALLQRGARVVGIETDRRAVALLKEKFESEIAARQFVLQESDARYLDLPSLDLPRKYKVISNIPYYLSGYLLRLFLETDHQPDRLVFLMQKEVVERIARSKKSSLLSVSVAVFGTPRYVKTVGRGHFSPMPNVDSAILQVGDIKNPFSSLEEREQFFVLLREGFGKKRKQLISNLSQLHSRAILESTFMQLNLPLTVRAEDLDTSTWLKLFSALSS